MKAVTCELCGSNDIIKIEGYFVCQHCGTKYSIDEAKHLVVDGTVKVSGVVTIDNSDNLKNLYQLAKRAVEIGDGEGAIKYYNRILEVDPMSWEAILYIGYFGVLTSKYCDISDATTSLTNAIYLSCEIVKNNIEDEEKQKQACIEISFRALFLADHLFECATGIDLAPENRTSYNVRKKRKTTNKGAERRWQERTTQLNRSLSSCGR